MLVIRLSKAFLVLLIGLWAALVALNNVTDYGSNYNFIFHVMTMDTTFPGNDLMWRAIITTWVHHGAYWLIITGESLTGLLCILSAVKLAFNARSTKPVFRKKKLFAIAGLSLGFFVWFFGFITVAAEWFLMWQSSEWNAVQAAFRFVMCLSVVLIYLSMEEPDFE